MTENEGDTRREVLKKATGLATAGAVSTAGCITETGSSRDFVPLSTGLPYVKIVSPSNDDRLRGQTGGGPFNTDRTGSEISPVSVENTEKISEKPVDKQPVLGPEGNVVATGVGIEGGGNHDQGTAVLVDSTGNVNEIDTIEETSTPIILDGSAIFGDARANMKYDISSGEKQSEIMGSSRAFKTLGENKVYQGIGGGFASFDPETMEIETEYTQDLSRNPTGEALLPWSQDRVIMSNAGSLRTHDLETDGRLGLNTDYDFTPGISSDGDVAVVTGRSDDVLAVVDPETDDLEIIDKLEGGFGTFNGVGRLENQRAGGDSCALIDEGETLGIYNVNDKGKAWKASFDRGNESLSRGWEEMLEGEGIGLVTWGEIALAGTEKGLYGLDTQNGEEVFSTTEAKGYPSIGRNNEVYSADQNSGLYRVEFEMGQPDRGGVPEIGMDIRDETVTETPLVRGKDDTDIVLYIENTGDGDFDAALTTEFDAEHDGETYTGEIPLTLESNSNGDIAVNYNPKGENKEFQSEVIESLGQYLDSQTIEDYELIQASNVEHPVTIEDGSSEVTIGFTNGKITSEKA